ncbi:hypothetical protein LWI28_003594 [Acer negundo]|uniref:Uncharacterized protein n=1 Tax=Acer negundo TaxID=4023 RepID=A0AAD5J969_ACENE|nr:hypothetical protein LWI28_003594 [Acer negundo]
MKETEVEIVDEMVADGMATNQFAKSKLNLDVSHIFSLKGDVRSNVRDKQVNPISVASSAELSSVKHKLSHDHYEHHLHQLMSNKLSG